MKIECILKYMMRYNSKKYGNVLSRKVLLLVYNKDGARQNISKVSLYLLSFTFDGILYPLYPLKYVSDAYVERMKLLIMKSY